MRSRCRCSMCPAIHITSRSWLRSSSTHEPSDPPLRVVIEFAIFRSPTSVYNYIHALSVHRPYIDIEKKNGTPGRRARGSSFFEPSQESGTEAVRTPLTPSSLFPVHERDRPRTTTGQVPRRTHNRVISSSRSVVRTGGRTNLAPRRLSRNPIGFSGRPGPPLSVHYDVVSVVSPASRDSVDRQTR